MLTQKKKRWVCRVLCLALLIGLSLGVLPLRATAAGAKAPVICVSLSNENMTGSTCGVPILMGDSYCVLIKSDFYRSPDLDYGMILNNDLYSLTYDGTWGDYAVFVADLPITDSSLFEYYDVPVVGNSYTLLAYSSKAELIQRSVTITDIGSENSSGFFPVTFEGNVDGVTTLAIIVNEDDAIIAICGPTGNFAMAGPEDSAPSGGSSGGETPSGGGSSGGSSSGGSSSGSSSSGTAGRDSGKSETVSPTTIAICVGGVVLVALVLFLLLKKKAPTPQPPQPPQPPIIPVNPIRHEQNNSSIPNGSIAGPTEPVSPPLMPGSVRLSLNVISGPMAGQCYPISDSATLVGRALEANIRYPADTKGVSRKHCQVFWKNGALHIMDLGSTSGTFLRGKGQLQANVPVALTAGDIIYLGSKQVALQLKAGS